MKFAFSILFITVSAAVFAQQNFQEVSASQAIFSTQASWGVALADYDNDGDDDIYITSNSTTEPNRLFKNLGNFSFAEVGHESGLDIRDNSKVAVWMDADNDGWLDIVIGNSSQVRLFKNNKNGTFSDASQVAGFGIPSSPNALLAGDLNGDQWLDLYSNNWAQPNQLFVNQGSGHFKNGIAGSGAEAAKQAMGGILFDIDQDGDLDIYLVFDGDQNVLFQNNGQRSFSDVSSARMLNVKGNGIGVDFADFNRDGKNDLYVSNLYDNSLYIGQPDGTFQNTAVTAGVNDHGMGWGTTCFDYNNDGFPDIYLINDYSFSPFGNKLYQNNGDNTFTDVAVGSPLASNKNGHGGAYADFDSDGLPDLVVANSNGGGVQVFRNATASTGHWLNLNLVGTTSNKFAVGARVQLTVNGVSISDEITAGSGYASQNSYMLHFGIDSATVVDEVVIHWPDGMVDTYNDVAANQRYLAIEEVSLDVFGSTQWLQALTQPNQLAAPTDVPADDNSSPVKHSVARRWNEALISAIRIDLARPTVHARTLFHTSMAMFDAWAAYDTTDMATPFFLNHTLGNYTAPFSGIAKPDNVKTAREEAISYAAFRILNYRFQNSPGASKSLVNFQNLFNVLGYDASFVSTDYSNGSSAALGNYIGTKLIEFGLQDGANEANQYKNQFYLPVNPPLRPDLPGNPDIVDPNRWQPLKIQNFIDQNGNVLPTTPPFLSAEWGQVIPFALTEADLNKFTRGGDDYWVYNDPGPPPRIDTVNGSGLSSEYKWNFSLVSIWQSHLAPTDGVMVDISPASKGNLTDYPTTVLGLRGFYDLLNGGDHGTGYTVNPRTGQPYQPQLVPRGDYTRVLAEFWADGPTSETPPGHWFTILNYVSDRPAFSRQFEGKGPKLDELEWDVKAYLTLGGAVHDAAVSAWGIKGYYDGIRPVSAIRFMADKGQSTDAALPHYHPAGIPLVSGLVELVGPTDPLAGTSGENVNKIKLYTWKGPTYIADPKVDQAGVGWILAENWYPYQRPSFVTPPFAGYISGHSTYSSAGAEVLTLLTGDEYFPGGLGEFFAAKNQFLVFEEGPSVDVKLQWARYKDAADQCSLSRIWGGIHPPFDDMPGRLIGKKIGNNAFQLASQYFAKTVAGIKEPAKSISVYPNPARRSDVLWINGDNRLSGSKIQLIDMIGRIVQEMEIPDNTSSPVQFDISSVSEGMYVVRIANNQVRFARKVIIH